MSDGVQTGIDPIKMKIQHTTRSTIDSAGFLLGGVDGDEGPASPGVTMGKGGGDDDAAAPGADTRLFWMEERISNALRLKPEKLKALQASSDARCAT